MQLKPEEKKKSKYDKKSRLIMIGSFLLIVCGVGALIFKYYQIYHDNRESEQKLDEFFELQNELDSSDDLDLLEENKEISTSKKQSTESYIAVLEIPKINLQRGIYAKDSPLNTVKKNVEILQQSDMPDKINGNFILAGHNGTSRVSFFNKLDKLKKKDEAYVYYNGNKYIYKLVNNYEVLKTGEVEINRNKEKTTLTLITCKHNYEIQTIYIFELVEDDD